MAYCNELIAGKLRRWEKYLKNFRLPAWEDIPDFGLYMNQLIDLLRRYLDYLPPELKEEQFITAATINNYVRTKVMPEPVKKRYYREHIAYLLIILSMKQSMSLSMITHLIPMGLSKEELCETYTVFARRHGIAAKFFAEQVREMAGPILLHTEEGSEIATERTEDLIEMSAVVGGFARLLAEKLLLLEGKTLENGGEIETHHE